MFPIFLSNKKCRLEHVVNKLMSCLITEFLGIFSYKLHGILLPSMDTLWHSMELHGTSGNPMTFHGTLRYFLEFHGPPRKLHGISSHSMKLHHYFMELRGTPWYSMGLHRYSMELHGIPWNSIDTPWNSMTFHGTPSILHGYSREVPWNSMDFHKFPWNSMDFHRFPWNSMEVFHTGGCVEKCGHHERVDCNGLFIPFYVRTRPPWLRTYKMTFSSYP